MADARQLVENLLLLEAQLLFVGQILPFAAAARTKMLTARHFAHLAQTVETNRLGLGITVLFPLHLQIDHVAWHTPRNKHHELALGRAVVGWNGDSHKRFALGGDVGNRHVFKNR